jgi:hypothetical protein
LDAAASTKHVAEKTGDSFSLEDETHLQFYFSLMINPSLTTRPKEKKKKKKDLC